VIAAALLAGAERRSPGWATGSLVVLWTALHVARLTWKTRQAATVAAEGLSSAVELGLSR
jgi:hypothetical protein